ncbi:MAG: peptide ABC transporter substrate-binding protein, partial [bacterium]
SERLQLFEKAEKRLIVGAPIIPIVFNKNKFLIRAEVQGWYPNLLDQHPLNRVQLIPSQN